jgi:ectoine hydroxylase-related dioxygenase (phytanoyl-CoA dioxygenase family)
VRTSEPSLPPARREIPASTCDRDIVAHALVSFDQDGYAVVPDCLETAEISRLTSVIAERVQCAKDAAVRRRHDVFAVRNLVDVVPEIRDVFGAPCIRTLLSMTLGEKPRLARSILFDKTASANWHVTWHQDLSIAVRRRIDSSGWECWTMKAGIQHVQPPPEILQRMVTVRLHLDPCDIDQGALRVIPGSHLKGRLRDDGIQDCVAHGTPVICAVAAGAAVLIKPLLVHASSTATRATHRRVLHFEFSPDPLPEPLEWLYGAIW